MMEWCMLGRNGNEKVILNTNKRKLPTFVK